MQIIEFEPTFGTTGNGAPILAKFSVQVTPDLKLCGLKLVDTTKGRRVFFPGVSGGGRAATASTTLCSQITEIASISYERHKTANAYSH